MLGSYQDYACQRCNVACCRVRMLNIEARSFLLFLENRIFFFFFWESPLRAFLVRANPKLVTILGLIERDS